MTRFSMRSRDFGLTYADAQNTTKEEIYVALQLKVLNDEMVEALMLCKEIGHQTGKRHYHAYIIM